MLKNIVWLLCAIIFISAGAAAQPIVAMQKLAGAFPVVSPEETATIVIDANADSLVQKTAALLQSDIEMVTGKKPPIKTSASGKKIILIGSVEGSAFMQQLAAERKLDGKELKGKWEAYQISLVAAPFPGVDQALVITGSDRRGTAYGVFELSRQMGISPWHWWADVPVTKKKAVYIKPGILISDAPKVKYRGIFINDEAPALSNWSRVTFGGFNHRFYEKVFQLMLRLKANYLWPAMWGNAFYDDDSLNLKTADNYGIVIGTSHHEPLMRAHDEWRRHGSGKWDYNNNEKNLQAFWRQGMQRATNEKIVSIGMRGDGDEPMSRETATALLERIVADQRNIIEDVTGKPAQETPQLWALYKEVQDYYDKGMRVPDDVTLLLSDDNWGNIRKLPKPTDKPRKGGYGIYYHFDYVGGPRNYKWLNTNNLARVWEQMHLAYRYGADRIWIVNVGDIKPMELPTSFFLDYAWNPEKWSGDNLRDYYTQWAEQQFGSKYAKQIGIVLRRYAQMSARRKPELLNEKSYPLSPYNEFEIVVNEWNSLQKDAEKLSRLLLPEYGDAYFQLVLHPVKAMANLHRLYWNVALNQVNAKDSNLAANNYAARAKELFVNDSLITLEYHQLNKGKWNHMMSQTHIGYTYWQQPEVNKMPAVYAVTNGHISDTTLNTARRKPAAMHLIPRNSKGNLFYEKAGYISIQAENWTRAVHGGSVRWKVIPDIGRTGSGVTTFPVTASSTLSPVSPHLEYTFYITTTGEAKINLHFSPTLNLHNDEGLQFAVSVDDEEPQVVSLNKDDKSNKIWESWVAANVIQKTVTAKLTTPGKHTLKYWALSPAVILQHLIIDLGGVPQTYLAPAETKYSLHEK